MIDTQITTGGIYRCCIGSFNEKADEQKVKIGDEFACHHCGEVFRLVEDGDKLPIWKPIWQIKE